MKNSLLAGILFLTVQLSAHFTYAATTADQNNTEKKSLFFVPALSLLLPGFGQAIDGQYARSATFAGVGISGLLISANAQERKESASIYRVNHVRDLEIQSAVGSQIYTHAGYMSAYDSFNSRVQAYKKEGKYTFLPDDQSTEKLMLTPFHFSYLERPTTWIPFVLAMGLGVSGFNRGTPPKFAFRVNDAVGSGYISYSAGTGEEALFRGIIHPMMLEYSGRPIASNLAQGLLFGYAHGPRPWPQIIAGVYLGWLSERNKFELGESIFIHTWWDVWIIGAEFARSRGFREAYELNIPMFQFQF